MQLISECNNGVEFLLCIFEIYIKYDWAALVKNKNGVAITNTFKEILGESGRKSNLI